MEWLEGLSEKVRLAYDSGDVNVFGEWVAGSLLSHSLERNIPLYSEYAEGKPTIEMEKFLGAAKKFGSAGITYNRFGKNRFHYVILSKDGILTVLNSFESGKISASIFTRNAEDLNFFRKNVAANLSEVSDGEVHVISKSAKGLRLEAIGFAHTPLERGNYDEEVLKAYDHIVKDLKSKKPTGRLSIIDGPAGTGKTHLIRAIMGDVNECIFVFMPPESVLELSGPSLIPLLNETRGYTEDGEKSTRSIAIVLEDADDILVPRGRDNMSAISALLNYTDGIFGALFDLRVIATTNAKKVEIEKALLRSGRLSRAITVGELSPEKATEVYRRITGDQKFSFDKPQILADVYARANGVEVAKDRKEDRLGFK